MSCHFYLYFPFCSVGSLRRLSFESKSLEHLISHLPKLCATISFAIFLHSFIILYLCRTLAFAAWFLACFTSLHLSFKLHLCARSSLNAVNVWSFEMQTNWLTQARCGDVSHREKLRFACWEVTGHKFQGSRHSFWRRVAVAGDIQNTSATGKLLGRGYSLSAWSIAQYICLV